MQAGIPYRDEAGNVVAQCSVWREAAATAPVSPDAPSPCCGCGASSPTSACVACSSSWCLPGPSSCGAVPAIYWVEHPAATAVLLCPDCAYAATRSALQQGSLVRGLSGRPLSAAAAQMDRLAAEPAPYPRVSAVLAPAV